MLRTATPPGGAAAVAAATRASAAPAAVAPAALRTNFAWTLAGNLVYAACQWGILVVVARLSAPEALGRLALGYAVTAPVFLFAGLNLRASQATDAARAFPFADYLAVRTAGMALALAVTVSIVLLSRYDAPTRLVVLAVGASKAVEGMSDAYYAVLQQHERMRPIAVSLAWRGVLSVAAVGAVLRAGGGLFAALVALTAAWASVLAWHDVRAAAPFLRAAAHRRARWPGAWRILVTSFPLGVVMMLVSLRTNLPRYFIQNRMGPADLGVFAALSSLLTAGNVVISALGQSATPRLARHYHEGDVKGFRRVLGLLLAVALAVGVAGIAVSVAAGRPVLLLLFGEPYAARVDVLVWLMAVGLVAYVASFLGYGLTAARRFGVQLPLFAATTLACAGASLWLVPAHGLAGAAGAWGTSMLLEIVALWIVLETALRRRAKGGAA